MSTCSTCATSFPSRNALFRHLRSSGCGNTYEASTTHRYILLFGYTGTPFYGSARNALADEELNPTAEGTLCSAIEHAMVDCECVVVHSRASRTDKGVHAFANAIHIKVTVKKKNTKAASTNTNTNTNSRTTVKEWCDAVNQHCAPRGVHVLRRFDVGSDPNIILKNECHKREYRYYIPYSALYLPSEKKVAQQRSTCSSVWLCFLPNDYDILALQSWAQSQLNMKTLTNDALHKVFKIVPNDHGGACHILTSSPHAAQQLASVLDGAQLPLDLFPPTAAAAATTRETDTTAHHRQNLLALLDCDAVVRKDIHRRLRASLKLLTGTKSFHHFCPRTNRGDGQSIRSVYRCRSGITSGWKDEVMGRSFAVVVVTGRSFLYHQIRNMMGLVVGVVGGLLPKEYIQWALNHDDDSEERKSTKTREKNHNQNNNKKTTMAKTTGTTTGKRKRDETAEGNSEAESEVKVQAQAEEEVVEVPLAPGANLVLSSCHFKGERFSSCVDGMGAQRVGVSDMSVDEIAVREKVVDAIVAASSSFDLFMQELREVVAPRMCQALLDKRNE